MDSIKLLIVDDHIIIRKGLIGLLKNKFVCELIVETASVDEIATIIEEKSITHLVLDLQLGNQNTLNMIPDLIQNFPLLRIMVYTSYSEILHGNWVMKVGASGYLNKSESVEEIERAFTLFFNNRKYINPNIRKYSNENLQSQMNITPFADLSGRELQVLQYLLNGLGNNEISEQMAINVSTVSTFKKRIFEKLEVENMVSLISLAKIHKVF